MDDTGWDKIVDAIDGKFGLDKHGRRTEPLEDKPELTQQVAFIEFEKDGERYKLERITHPAIIERKSHYTRTAGSTTRFENIYDPTETSHKTNLYRYEGGEWEAVEASALAL